MATLTSSLIVRLIDQVSTPARAISRSLLGLNNQVKGGFGARLAEATERNNRALSTARGRLFDAAAGFYALKTAISSPVKAAMEFESAMADVRKVVDFGGESGFKAFQDQLISLSKRVPVSVNGLAAIAAAAGQAGIAGDDLVKFTEAAAKVGVAFDITADQAGDAMAKLMTGLGMTIDEAVLLTDAMNQLSNAQASSASEVLDFVRRTGSMAKGFGISAEQAAAFGSAMIAAGAQVDVSSTSFQNMGAALVSGVAATGAQQKAFKRLGLDARKVATAMQVDADGTILSVLEKINELPADVRQATIFQLFGKNADAIMPLVNNLKLLRESLGLVDDATKYSGSAFREYEVRAKTFQNAVQLFNNRLEAMKIVIGAALIPAINDLMASLEPVIEKITQFAQAHPEVVRNVMMAAASLIAFKIAMAGLSFVGLVGRGGALSMLALGFNTVGKAAIGASRGARGALALQTALGAMNGLKMGGVETVLVALRGMVMAVPGVTAIGSALAAMGGALAAISAPVWGGIAIAVAAVAGAGFMLWKYWDRVSSVVGGFVGRLGELAVQIPGVRPTLDAFAAVGRSIGAGWEWALGKLREFGDWIGSFFQREVLTDEQKAQWGEAGRGAADSLVNSVKAVIQGMIDWFTGLPGRIRAAIGSIDIGSLIQWPTPPAWLSRLWGGDAATGQITAPVQGNGGNTVYPVGQGPGAHRAGGGPVWPGSSFLVGEKEPEVFSPKTGGTITPLSKLGGGGRSVSIGTLIIQEAANAHATAKAVTDELNRLARGAHSDSEAWA